MKKTSFLSEHSVEFCLVSTLCRILEKKWVVTPLYFWSTREGSRLGSECENGKQMKILAMFARRPKMSQLGDTKIQIKVNATLLERASDLSELGIPTVCGVPLVTSLLKFHLSSPCVWFRIITRREHYTDAYAEVDIGPYTHSDSPCDDSLLAIAEEDFTAVVDEARKMTLSDVIFGLKGIGRYANHRPSSRFLSFYTRYKPVYFLLTERNPAHDN